jgi:hypothetical protein
MAASAEAVSCKECTPLTPEQKVGVLRRYEEFCYQVAFYLLKDKKQAESAVEDALVALYKQEVWFKMNDNERSAKAKQVSLIMALEARKNSRLPFHK